MEFKRSRNQMSSSYLQRKNPINAYLVSGGWTVLESMTKEKEKKLCHVF